MVRDINGSFMQKGYGEKKLRSIRISDEGWDKLQALAEAQNCSRADLIENLARGDIYNQSIVSEAIEKFVETKKATWGKNGTQKGEFNSNSRTWDIFNQFIKFVEAVELAEEDEEHDYAVREYGDFVESIDAHGETYLRYV